MFSYLKRARAGQKKFKSGLQLNKEKRYTEAEALFRQSAQEQEKVLGKEHIDTLHSKYWLGRTLYVQGKYAEAEEPLQQTAQEHEKVLGKEHIDTLHRKYWLGRTLYMQGKDVEAEELLQQAAQRCEKVLGKEHIDTLDSKYWLGRTLYMQGKYVEAAELLQQTAQGHEKVLGKEHINTFDSKYWLGRTLYMQGKYVEAAELLQQTVQEHEKVLGKEHIDTLDSKHWLGRTLYMQGKYVEAAELLQQVAQGQEKVLGKDHTYTLASQHFLQEILLVISPSASMNNSTKAVISRLGDFFREDRSGRGPYNDSDIFEISTLLKLSHPRWSKVPRTYIILRTIGCLELLDDFIDVGFSDHWFPITERSLPNYLRPSLRSQFVAAQSPVLTKSMDLEKSEAGRHRYFQPNEPLPFETKGILGSGGFGQVDRVLSLISFREYARKRVRRSSVFGGRGTEDMKRFIAEIEILKRLKHRHVVEFVGSYTDPKYMGLILSPVAEMDLSTYLVRTDSTKHGELRMFFGCLAKALEFMHERNIRHKDIKPSNILVDRGNVLFTDFGLSLDFTDKDGSTTISMGNGMTPRYCAPEVAMQEPRNTASDIWSLGVVFLEMIVVLKGKTVEHMYEFLKEHGSGQEFVRSNKDGLLELITELDEVGLISDNRALRWVQQMLLIEQQLRPTATALVASIVAVGEQGNGSATFCGICCSSLDDDDSDVVDEIEDHQ